MKSWFAWTLFESPRAFAGSIDPTFDVENGTMHSMIHVLFLVLSNLVSMVHCMTTQARKRLPESIVYHRS